MRLWLIGWSLLGAMAATSPAGGQAVPAAAGDNAARPRGPAPAAAADGPRVLRQNTFNIPFSVDPARTPREVQLFVSVDGGRTWKLYARQHPSARFFQFRAGGDGHFWFASRTVQEQTTPPEMNGRTPELHVIVDTTQPQFTFHAAVGPAGEVITSWRVSDTTLDAQSLKIEYQADDDQPWQPVAVERPETGAAADPLVGSITWWPQTSAASINVRAEVSDRAGNKAVVTRPLRLAARTSSPTWKPPLASNPRSLSDRIPSDPYSQAQASPGGVEWPADNRLPAPAPGTRAPAATAASPPRGATPPPGYAAADELTDVQRFRPAASPVRPPVTQQIAAVPPAPQDAVAGAPPADAAAPARSDLPPGERPRMTRSKRFQLDYEIDAVAANGVRDVELWATEDAGRTWSRWQVDGDRQSPVEVEVAREGLFGFRIVVVGNNGLVGRTPKNGDLADLWVGVDETAPQLRITSAFYGQHEHAGQLDIRWSAQDSGLAERPISLMFSDQPNGPWTTIASGLPNSGQYFWPIDPRVPEQIYLRAEARDEAGNVADDVLSEPISLSGLTPKAHIRGIRPVAPTAPRGARRNPYYR